VSRKKVSRNAPCPCGSGKKYKKCCWGKGFEWEEDEDGSFYRSTPLSPEMADILQMQRQKFIDKHGREPGPNDPVFFDMPPLEHVEHEMVEAMKKAGIDPAFIYAFEKTGLLVTEENQHLLPESALAEWQAAIEEYEAKHRKPPEYPIGTVAHYGPDDKRTTKIAAGVILHDGAEPIMMRWVATDVTTSPKVQQELKDFFLQHEVKSVVATDRNIGCPHEEGLDFPDGEDCPFCPFWKGKQGSNQKE
jgi:SEC-C motif